MVSENHDHRGRHKTVRGFALSLQNSTTLKGSYYNAFRDFAEPLMTVFITLLKIFWLLWAGLLVHVYFASVAEIGRVSSKWQARECVAPPFLWP